MSDTHHSLFAEAEQRLEEQETPDDWGDKRQPAEGERVLARYLGEALEPPFNERVYRFIDYPGTPTPFYIKHYFQLGKVLEQAAIGDIVGLVRGTDKDIGRDYPMQTWDGWARSCDEPLPGRQTTTAAAGGTALDDIPFGASVY